ncbi:cellulose binding domain-containing protein [Exilibacterium tricleocarpae]|nr:cellulose binding domain-containing protein [Exilibacterium tricleocarpae]
MSKFTLGRSLLAMTSLVYASTLHAADCRYDILNEWNSGFTASITITNNTTETIDGWSVTWEFTDGASVSQIWKASLAGANPYTATNLGYNRTIAPGATTDFGFNGSKATANTPAVIPELAGICTADNPVNTAPQASASAAPLRGSIPLNVTFDGSGSSDADGDPLTYRWDFGGGETATEAVVTKTFDQAGTFPVTLTVNDGTVDSASVTLTITAEEPDDTTAYSLDPVKSSLHFVSTKKVHVLETHSFSTLSGSITNSGAATLKIDLDSVATGIDIRDERMRNLLFETGTFPEATVSLPVDMERLAGLATGDSEAQAVAASVNLHGVSVIVETQVFVTRLSASSILVENADPIIIKAGDFDLTNGVDALRDVANLSVISYSIPVNFTLFFNTP